ncbi:hypothetical protein ACFYNO_34780 [Kitasatospora sp. NPDC006697]
MPPSINRTTVLSVVALLLVLPLSIIGCTGTHRAAAPPVSTAGSR